MRTFTFRQPQRLSPLALRRLQLQDVESQRREEIAAGNQELRAMQEMTRLEQEEYKIRQQLATERQVGSAQREVSKLDVTSPTWREDYARIMSAHPRAAGDKFLNENFNQLGRVYEANMKHFFATEEEEQKQRGRVDMETMREHSKLIERGMAMNVDPGGFKTKDGNDTDWSAYTSAVVNAQKEFRTKADDLIKSHEMNPNVTETEKGAEIKWSNPKAPTIANQLTVAKQQGQATGFANLEKEYGERAASEKDPDEKKKLLDQQMASHNDRIRAEGEAKAMADALKPQVSGRTQPQSSDAVRAFEDVVEGRSTTITAQAPPAGAATTNAQIIQHAEQVNQPGGGSAMGKPNIPFPEIPTAAIEYLRKNPTLTKEFEEQFGPGSSKNYLTPTQ